MGAQSSSTITGTVNDMQGEPLIGANVRQKGTNNGTVTDLSGHFSIKVPAGAMLIVSYVGFNEQEVKAQSNMVITLSDEAKSIDEVVVVGYGVQKKVNLTGAVSSVKGSDLAMRPVTDASQSLQGLVPGLLVSIRS